MLAATPVEIVEAKPVVRRPQCVSTFIRVRRNGTDCAKPRRLTVRRKLTNGWLADLVRHPQMPLKQQWRSAHPILGQSARHP